MMMRPPEGNILAGPRDAAPHSLQSLSPACSRGEKKGFIPPGSSPSPAGGIITAIPVPTAGRGQIRHGSKRGKNNPKGRAGQGLGAPRGRQRPCGVSGDGPGPTPPHGAAPGDPTQAQARPPPAGPTGSLGPQPRPHPFPRAAAAMEAGGRRGRGAPGGGRGEEGGEVLVAALRGWEGG